MNNQYTQVFQELLFREPLYNFIGKNEHDMNILVIGWGEATPAFIDQCLQAGQMDTHALNITVLSLKAQTRGEDYLLQRPALKDFVDVDGSLQGTDLAPYATLNFQDFPRERELFGGDDETCVNMLTDILSDAPDEKYHYFLVATDNACENRRVSGQLALIAQELMLGGQNIIYYISDSDNENFKQKNVIPVLTKGTNEESPVSPELERMAYNAHMVWDDSIDGDNVAGLAKFKENQYNYQSSVAQAMSVKYRLADFGIGTDDVYNAAAKLENMVKIDKGAVDRLAALEHRRWVLEKVTDGWTAPALSKIENEIYCEDYYRDCIGRCSVKNEARKIHPCIVRSRADSSLATGDPDFNRDIWTRSKKTLADSGLDDLDRFSVELHKEMRSSADELKKTAMPDSALDEIKDKIDSSEACDDKKAHLLREWGRFRFCIKNILDGNLAYAKGYDRHKDFFFESVRKYDRGIFDDIKSKIDEFDRKLWSTLEANMHRDYKDNDRRFVRKIPFILTYRADLTLITALQLPVRVNNMNDVAFGNVASLTVIKPSRVIYLLYIDKDTEDTGWTIFKKMARHISQYMAYKNIKCKISFEVMCDAHLSDDKKDSWERAFRDLKGKARKGANGDDRWGYDLTYVESEDEAIERWEGILSDIPGALFDGSAPVFRSMAHNADFVAMARNHFKYFEFDPRTKKFTNNGKCQFLSYIEDNTYLGIEEMFGLAGAEDMEFHYPMLGESYKNLWDIYTGKNRNKKATDKKSIMLEIKNWNLLCNAIEEYHKDMPATMEVKLSELKHYYDQNVNDPNGFIWKKILAIIDELEGKNSKTQFLIPVPEEGEITGFKYKNEDVKRLLTKAGEILEICTYFAVCELGYFDEVACGYHFQWEDPNVDNELDLVLTKGFQSIIVECKGRDKLDQDFYFKLDGIVDIFGIGAHEVILTMADYAEDQNDKKLERENKKRQEILLDNKIKITRGELMDVKTISGIYGLKDLAQELKDVIDKPERKAD